MRIDDRQHHAVVRSYGADDTHYALFITHALTALDAVLTASVDRHVVMQAVGRHLDGFRRYIMERFTGLCRIHRTNLVSQSRILGS